MTDTAPNMPQKDRENSTEERIPERRHRSKSEKEKERDPNRPHKPKRPKVFDPETGEWVKQPRRHKKDKDKERERDRDKGKREGDEDDEEEDEEAPKRSLADAVPELARTASTPGAWSRSSLPYPSFSKAHSREAVNSRESLPRSGPRKSSIYTPEPTDLGSEAKERSKSVDHLPTRAASTSKNSRPPSPPETEFSQHRKSTTSRMTRVEEDEESVSRLSSRVSSAQRQSKDDGSKLSARSKSSKASTAVKSPIKRTFGSKMTDDKSDTGTTTTATTFSGSGIDSNVTPVASKRRPSGVEPPRPLNIDTDSSPDSAQDSSPKTPTQPSVLAPHMPTDSKPTAPPFSRLDSQGTEKSYDSPKPPPPPPPPLVPRAVPRVDYLMQNGGLLRPIPKTLLSVQSTYNPTRPSSQSHVEVEKIFGPFYNILNQYETVIKKHGSLAVATGYRSVARRLLDRLENVFARDLPSEGCTCVMCLNADPETHEGSRGLGWGEVLEWVSGRRELPNWPAFDFSTLGVKTANDIAGLGIAVNQSGGEPERPKSPVKIDPDIAEEYREHFLQQSKKTKMAVNRWLSSCPQTAAAPPQEVDDETLSFAMLTHLNQSDRPVFNALISGATVLQPASRAPTPLRRSRPDFMIKTALSIQRLYRLQFPPRDPEAAIYLLENPQIHNLLTTMSAINPQEWEILISGRFDGFLWSGADSQSPSVNPSPAPSRGPTPANGESMRFNTTSPMSQMRSQTFSPSMFSSGVPSRGPTPSSQRHAVSNDEETEIAVLAEVERDIYLGMEALEDAFEALHRKAEIVRQGLRERGAGLSMSMQSRRTSHPNIIPASSSGLPSAGLGMGYERPSWAEGSEIASESDWDPGDELMSELAPDDSASNISSSRHRRPKRRNERRTPAPVEEEDED